MSLDRRTVLHGLLTGTAAAMLALPRNAAAAVYERPYGANAPWNIPVADLPEHPGNALWSERLYSEQSYTSGGWTLSLDGYTYPVYDAADAVGQYTVSLSRPKWGNLHGATMPWNPAWEPSPGSDAQVIVLDPATGREWNLWKVGASDTTSKIVYAGSGSLVPGSYWSKEDGFPPPRGCGIQCLAMLVRPQEVAQGRIEHALSMPVRSPNSETYVAPATKLEGHPMATSTGIPEGMRFALRMSDAEINAWVASLPYQLGDQGKRSARIIATAMRDYGWFVTDGGGAVHLQFEDRLSAGGQWNALGLGKRTINYRVYPRDLLLTGLIRRDRVYAVVPSDQY